MWEIALIEETQQVSQIPFFFFKLPLLMWDLKAKVKRILFRTIYTRNTNPFCTFFSIGLEKEMAWFLKYNFVEIFAILLSTIVLVNSLPTSVLVDTKQQQNEQTTTAALNKGKICICTTNNN